MVFSTKYSHIFLRLGLAFVFFWLGIDKFLHPTIWLGFTSNQFIYFYAIAEILIGLSLITGVFIKTFSLIAILSFALMIFYGEAESLILSIATIMTLFAIFLWPDRER